MNATAKGAAKSWVIWFNLALTLLAGLELASAHLTTLFGPKVAAGIMLLGSLANIALRFKTTQALAEKGAGGA